MGSGREGREGGGGHRGGVGLEGWRSESFFFLTNHILNPEALMNSNPT